MPRIEIAAFHRAVARCGHWPTVATLAQYQVAVDRAVAELERTAMIEGHYQRRFGQPIGDSERAGARLAMRREVARAIAEQRSECLRLLASPAAGSA
jgi:hypothetical protein